MGLDGWKKGIWVLLFFSLALNLGFALTVFSWKFMPRFTPPPPPGPPLIGPDGMGPGPLPIHHIIDKMDLSDEVRSQVKETLQKMKADHLGFMRQVFEKEKKALELIGKPGSLDVDMIAPLIESADRLRKQEAYNKAKYIVEIRRLLGREKSVYLLSEIKKEFQKRDPRDRLQD